MSFGIYDINKIWFELMFTVNMFIKVFRLLKMVENRVKPWV